MKNHGGRLEWISQRLEDCSEIQNIRKQGVNRFDGFDTSNFEASNEKTPEDSGELTDLTDLTAKEMGVYVSPARARLPPRPPARPGSTPLPSNCRQIRQTRQIAGRQRGKIGGLRPRGVKRVKSPPRSDYEVTK